MRFYGISAVRGIQRSGLSVGIENGNGIWKKKALTSFALRKSGPWGLPVGSVSGGSLREGGKVRRTTRSGLWGLLVAFSLLIAYAVEGQGAGPVHIEG